MFDGLLILFRIARCTSAGKKLTSWLSVCAVLLYAVLFFFFVCVCVCVPFAYDVWGRKWNSIASVPDYCSLIYNVCDCSRVTVHKGIGIVVHRRGNGPRKC